jgi:1,4-dihydroxy-2-naphthoate octaprenyltransferase
VAIGAASIVCGILYTAGPKPLAYVGLGDLFVFVFFGLVAVAGTYFVQARSWTAEAWLAGCGPGFLSVAILGVNNLRDRMTDAKAGKRTLAVRFGARFARWEYAVCLLGAAAVPVLLLALHPERRGVLAASVAMLFGWPVARRVFRLEGRDLNPCLGQTGLLLLVYGVAFTVGWLL